MLLGPCRTLVGAALLVVLLGACRCAAEPTLREWCRSRSSHTPAAEPGATAGPPAGAEAQPQQQCVDGSYVKDAAAAAAVNCSEPLGWMLPERNWRLGLALQGSDARLRAAVHRLIHEGRNLTVGFVGGCTHLTCPLARACVFRRNRTVSCRERRSAAYSSSWGGVDMVSWL